MSVIIGCDPQLRRLAAVALDDENNYRLYSRTYIGDRIDTRVNTAHLWMRFILREEMKFTDEIAVYIEAPFVGYGPHANVRTGLDLGKLHGALLSSVQTYRLPVFPVNNQHWKKQVIGGKVDKDRIASYVAETWPVIYSDIQKQHKDIQQDLCDALGIAEYGRQQWPTDKQNRLKKHA